MLEGQVDHITNKLWHSWAKLSSYTLDLLGISSQLLITWFWWKFKDLFLGTSRTDSNCHCDICLGNICQYQKYLSCYEPDFDETLNVGFWDNLEQIPTVTVTIIQATFVLVTFDHIRISKLLLTRFDETLNVASWEDLEQIPTFK